MLINTDYIAPAELTGYVREALQDLQVNQFTLSQYLPNRVIDDLQYRFTAGGEGLVEAASYRAYDAESPIGSRPGITQVTGEIPPVSRKIRLGEYDRLRQRSAQQQIGQYIQSDAVRMTRAVAARVELARGDALANGTITMDENGVIATVDFGRDPSHTAAPSGALWSDTATSEVLTDLVAWYDIYVATNGSPPGTILTSTTVSRLMQRNAEVIAAVAGTQTGRTRVTAAELNDLLRSENLPPVDTYDARVTIGGASTRVIPDDRLLLLPPAGDPGNPESTDLGATLYGTTAESLEPGFGIEDGEEPGIVAGAYSTQDPVALWSKAAGISLPVMANPNLSFSATVV